MVVTTQTPSKLYSTHASRPRKRPTSTTILRAIAKVMKAELSSTAIDRWHEQLDEELGEPLFKPDPHRQADSFLALKGPVEAPKTWCPCKPVVTRLLANALVSKSVLSDGRPVALAAPLTIGSTKGSGMAKIISRRLVELVISNDYETLRASGEIRAALFAQGAEKQLSAAIARHATDVITYVSTRVKEIAADKGKENVVLEMQTVDQCLYGRETRGSGLVVCENGMRLVQMVASDIAKSENDVAVDE